MQKILKVSILISLFSTTSIYADNPATKKYVDDQIAAINTRINNLTLDFPTMDYFNSHIGRATQTALDAINTKITDLPNNFLTIDYFNANIGKATQDELEVLHAEIEDLPKNFLTLNYFNSNIGAATEAAIAAVNTKIDNLPNDFTTLTYFNSNIGTATQTAINTQGVPVAGNPGQILAKNSNSNFDTHWIDLPTVTTFSIGQQAFGGVIFWLDTTKQHGLIAAMNDQTNGIPWDNNPSEFPLTGATGDGFQAGKMNTALIFDKVFGTTDNTIPTSFAAGLCTNYRIQPDGITPCSPVGNSDTSTCYGDWYLPSIYELNQLFNASINNTPPENYSILNGAYWSSNEIDNFDALSESNSGSTQLNKTEVNKVRCVRSF